MIVLTASLAHGGAITIDDPSFETPVLTDGQLLTGRDVYCVNNPPPYNVPGCSGFGSSAWLTADSQSDSNGVLNPTIGPTDSGSSINYPMFTYIPDGDQVAYTHGSAFFQILPVTIQADTTYTLTFWIGERQDIGSVTNGYQFIQNQGYYGELAGGASYDTRTAFLRTVGFPVNHSFGVTSLNAADSPMPGYGEWLQISVSYTFGASDPLIGQNLIVSFGAPAIESNFDLVSIDATPTSTPEPASYAMMGAGLGLLGFWHRRRKLRK